MEEAESAAFRLLTFSSPGTESKSNLVTMNDSSIPKLSVGGLKLSPELVQIRLFPKAGCSVEEMFRRLADQKD